MFLNYSNLRHLLTRRLSLDTKVDLKKLRFFTIPHDSGSFMVSPVSKELLEIQRKVRSIHHSYNCLESAKKSPAEAHQIQNHASFSRWCSVWRLTSESKSKKCASLSSATAPISGYRAWIFLTRTAR